MSIAHPTLVTKFITVIAPYAMVVSAHRLSVIIFTTIKTSSLCIMSDLIKCVVGRFSLIIGVFRLTVMNFPTKLHVITRPIRYFIDSGGSPLSKR